MSALRPPCQSHSRPMSSLCPTYVPPISAIHLPASAWGWLRFQGGTPRDGLGRAGTDWDGLGFGADAQGSPSGRSGCGAIQSGCAFAAQRLRMRMQIESDADADRMLIGSDLIGSDRTGSDADADAQRMHRRPLAGAAPDFECACSHGALQQRPANSGAPPRAEDAPLAQKLSGASPRAGIS